MSDPKPWWERENLEAELEILAKTDFHWELQLLAAIRALRPERDQLRARVAELEATFAEYGSWEELASSRIVKLEEDLKERDKRITELEAKLATAEGEKADAEWAAYRAGQ